MRKKSYSQEWQERVIREGKFKRWNMFAPPEIVEKVRTYYRTIYPHRSIRWAAMEAAVKANPPAPVATVEATAAPAPVPDNIT